MLRHNRGRGADGMQEDESDMEMAWPMVDVRRDADIHPYAGSEQSRVNPNIETVLQGSKSRRCPNKASLIQVREKALATAFHLGCPATDPGASTLSDLPQPCAITICLWSCLI
jgi:hypothetical protein